MEHFKIEKNALDELEWLKRQLGVDDKQIELMVMELKDDNIIKDNV